MKEELWEWVIMPWCQKNMKILIDRDLFCFYDIILHTSFLTPFSLMCLLPLFPLTIRFTSLRRSSRLNSIIGWSCLEIQSSINIHSFYIDASMHFGFCLFSYLSACLVMSINMGLVMSLLSETLCQQYYLYYSMNF